MFERSIVFFTIVCMNLMILGDEWEWFLSRVMSRMRSVRGVIEKGARGRLIEEQSTQDVFARLVSHCGYAKDLLQGRRIHARILESEHGGDRYLGNLLVQMYGKCGSLEDAFRVFEYISPRNPFSWSIIMAAYIQNEHVDGAKSTFDRMPERNLVSWTAMVAAYAQNGHMGKAKDMFDSMPTKDVVSWTAIVQGCAQNGYLPQAKSTFDRMPNQDVISWNSMITVYAQSRHLDEAKILFNSMSERSVVSWTAMITAYAQGGHLLDAKNTFDEMPERNVVSWNAMVACYAQAGDMDRAKRMFNLVPEWSLVSWNALVVAYAQHGYLEEAKKAFDAMPGRSVISWNAMVQVYLQNSCSEEAKVAFDNMPEQDVVSWTSMVAVYAQCGQVEEVKCLFDTMPRRNVVVWTTVVSAYAQNGHLRQAKSTFDSMPEWNMVPWTAMLMAYAQNGRIDEAEGVFESMAERDVISWSAMTAAYAQNGHGPDAIQTFLLMILEGLKPDEVSFGSVLLACSYLGMVEISWNHFTSMRADHGLQPTRDHFCCMIDILGRAGQLRDAEDLVNSMPYEPNDVVWGSLLAACRTYRDIECGARAAKHLFELNPQNASSYVLLGNMYAAVGRHADVAMVKRLMKENGVKRQQCMSIIEVKNKVHKFIVGDTSHSQNQEIHAELQRLNKLMVEAGFVADTKEVLHDVIEDEKEQMLHHHSEKLAIAFGLLATKDTPLWIMKNLRVCSDCHTATKFISRITQRKIVVRDSNRFHHFENGVCSCYDYW